MKVMLSVNHPAWVHQFRHIVETCEKRGDQVCTLAVDKDGDLKLLDQFHIPYILCARSTGKNVVEKAFLFAGLCFRYTWHAIRFRPDVVIGRASPMLAIAAWVCRAPQIIYEDTEVSRFSLKICKRLTTKILTPRTFLTALGPAQEYVDSYKELFYLHPNVFRPDREVLRKAGFNPDEPYIFVRFIAWNASHDYGRSGLSDEGKIELVRRLEKYGKVYISSEGSVPEELKPNLLKTPYEIVHHVLAFAKLVYSEGATMASEAAVLGTHALYVNTIQSGTTQEQESRFDILYCFNEPQLSRYERALQKAEELLSMENLVELGHEKQKKLLAEKVDINNYYLEQMQKLVQTGRKRS